MTEEKQVKYITVKQSETKTFASASELETYINCVDDLKSLRIFEVRREVKAKLVLLEREATAKTK
jgi:hypothetical protein